MEQRIFHGDITPKDLARALVGEFNRGAYQVQQVGDDQQIIVQIATRDFQHSGGDTAFTVTLRAVEDGVAVQIGKQAWLGVAASLGQTALAAFFNPWSIINRLGEVAQDIESLQLTDDVWKVIEGTAHRLGATFALSERLQRLVCPYCQTANPVGEPSCIACGAPLGGSQPFTCPQCGYVVKRGEAVCPNCGRRL